MPPQLARIRVYPIKSLDGQDLQESPLLEIGALTHDREYCLLDAEGSIVNTKGLGAALVRLRSDIDLAFGDINVRYGEAAGRFHLQRQKQEAEKWLSEQIGIHLTLSQDLEKGFPDDPEAPGPTVVSTATLETVASWFKGLSVDEVRRRFRPNLEIVGVPPFWEDRLVGVEGSAKRFRIGDVVLEGRKICARCAVPSLDSLSGKLPEPKFAKIFAEKRRETLPEWAEKSRFDHFYRLMINTTVPAAEVAKVLHVGDQVTVLE